MAKAANRSPTFFNLSLRLGFPLASLGVDSPERKLRSDSLSSTSSMEEAGIWVGMSEMLKKLTLEKGKKIKNV